MKKNIQISIPTPCHENWQDMKPVERGRFCDSCQKKVRDFTASPDKVIMEAIAKDNRLCGRFRVDQLERNLIVPTEKNTLWIAACAAVLGFLGIGTHQVAAQETPRQSVYSILPLTKDSPVKPAIDRYIFKGKVAHTVDSISIPNTTVINRFSLATATTDANGNFAIEVAKGETLEIIAMGFENLVMAVTGDEQPGEVIFVHKKLPEYVLGGLGMKGMPVETKDNVRGTLLSIWDFFR